MRNKQKNIIIFTDPGMDDAIALIWLGKQKQINIKPDTTILITTDGLSEEMKEQ